MAMIDVFADFSFSPRYLTSGFGLPFGLAAVSGVDAESARHEVADAKIRAMEKIRSGAKDIQARIDRFETFFRTHGFKCPLPRQFARVQQEGALPAVTPFVDALLCAEMAHGLLMGVQDRTPIAGRLTYDLADGGEQYLGMRGTVTCRDNEMVLRDDRGIVASYFQGPDKRSAIQSSTRDLVFYAFAAPGIDVGVLGDALADACGMFGNSSEDADYRVYSV
jgi:DNA/RNA-binding domain of Phe-tRNA-synthetase-like protein